jgi:hypothetical protein
MKHEYHEGSEALEQFGKTMTARFRIPKTTIAKRASEASA